MFVTVEQEFGFDAYVFPEYFMRVDGSYIFRITRCNAYRKVVVGSTTVDCIPQRVVKLGTDNIIIPPGFFNRVVIKKRFQRQRNKTQ